MSTFALLLISYSAQLCACGSGLEQKPQTGIGEVVVPYWVAKCDQGHQQITLAPGVSPDVW